MVETVKISKLNLENLRDHVNDLTEAAKFLTNVPVMEPTADNLTCLIQDISDILIEADHNK